MNLCKLFYNENSFIEKAKNDEWAIVSGGTDGVGLAFVKKLHNLKYNLLVTGRDDVKLEEIKTKYNATVILVDHANPVGFAENFRNTIINKNISVVINNVGMSYKYPCEFVDNSLEFYNSLLKCNMLSIVEITYEVLKQNKNTLFINLSSMLANLNIPYLTCYSASKAFVKTFSQSLKNENVNVLCLEPWLISTKMSRVKPSFFVPTSDEYAESIINYGLFLPHTILTLLYNIPIIGTFFHKYIYKMILYAMYKNKTS